MNSTTRKFLGRPLARRSFLKATSGLAAATALSGGLTRTRQACAAEFTGADTDLGDLSSQVGIQYSICQMCHGRCGIRVKVADGAVLKIDGNPYHPANRSDDARLPFATDPSSADVKKLPGAVCAKAQAGLEVLYNPFRIKQPLKRVGPRGSNRWQTVTWDQALDDIAARLQPFLVDDAINPAIPELGSKRNLIVFAPGRLPHGGKEFTDRIFGNGMGSVNKRHDHTSICETSHHVAYNLATGGSNDLKPDIENCEYILYFGTNPLAANFSFVAHARKLMRFRARGGQMTVVDPLFNTTAAKATRWVPIKPGTDAAFALGMTRYIIEQNRHNSQFLRNANQAAANAVANGGYKTWTDATHLVVVQQGHASKGKFLTPAEAGLTGAASTSRVCLVAAAATEVKSSSTGADAVVGDLDVSGLVNGIAVKSVFRMLKERATESSVAQYASICGVAESDITAVATEFTSHGFKAAADCYRGPVQHTNGVYTAWAILHLNTLIGNYDRKGGLTKGGSHFHEVGGAANTVDLKAVPGGKTAAGINLTRVGVKYDATKAPKLIERDGPVPPRPWFPFAQNGNFQEVLSAIDAGYPYGPNASFALFTYWNIWNWSTPGGRVVFERVMKDEAKVPLFVAFDVDFGDASVFADYILPDATYLEVWHTPHFSAVDSTTFSGWRQPVVGKAREAGSNTWQDVASAGFRWDASKDWEYQPLFDTRTLLDALIGLGKRLGIPGVGSGAFGSGAYYSQCDRAWHWARNTLQNFATESGKAAQDIIDRGGVFKDPGSAYSGDFTAGQIKKLVNIYNEVVAATTDTMTGAKFDGLPKYVPLLDFKDRPIDDSAQFPYQLTTYKLVTHGQGRTVSQAHLMQADRENFVELSATDAAALGVAAGDLVRLTSASDSTGVIGKALVTARLRPGVIAVSHHFGHFHMGSQSVEVDGTVRKVDDAGALRASAPERAAGLTVNPIMRLDPAVPNVCLTDKIGGSASFFDTWVQVQKI